LTPHLRRAIAAAMTDQDLDLSGLLCPLPVLKAGKALKAMARGAVLRVTATDPMAAIDMPHFCAEQGHRLLSQDQRGGSFIFRIERT
jgi:tRNA 2-thiouridine synthesizing protein A